MIRKVYRISAVLALLTLVSIPAWAAVLQTGDPAPDFILTAMTGEKVQLSALKGNLVVLGLFHICEPCRQQATILQQVQKKNPGLKIVGVNASGDSREDVQDYLNSFETKVTFPYLLDPGKQVEKLYSVRATPNVYILDRDGIVRFKGAFTRQEAIEKVLASIPKD